MIFFGEALLRRAIENDVDHYHQERNHQGMDNDLIDPSLLDPGGDGQVNCRKRLGGLLRYYHREEA